MVSVEVLRPVHEESNLYASSRTMARPLEGQRSQFVEGGTDLTAGATTFTHVQSGAADVGHVIHWREQYFEVIGVSPQGMSGVMVELATEQFEGEVRRVERLAIGGERLLVGGERVTI